MVAGREDLERGMRCSGDLGGEGAAEVEQGVWG